MTIESEVRGLLERAQTARRGERYAEAKRDLVAAIDLMRPDAPLRELAGAVRTLAEVERRLEQPGLARAHYEEAVVLCRRLGEAAFLAHTLRHLADVLVDAGEIGAAGQYYREALLIYGRLDPPRPSDHANALRAHGVQQRLASRLDAAGEMLREARVIYTRLGMAVAVAEMSARLAEIAHEQGDAGLAREEMERARTSATESADDETAEFVEATAAKLGL